MWGRRNLLNIVCGAPNARVGIRIPCAMVGAELPPGEDGKPFVIKVGKLRGVESQGMLCSAKELQISQEGSGLMELPADAPLGVNVRDYLNLDDTLFTLKLTPNLAHCLSVYGVARELAALTGAPLNARQRFLTINVTNDSVSASKNFCNRSVRPFFWSCDSQRQYHGQNSSMDGGSFGTLRPAQRGTHWWTFPTTSCSSWGGRRTFLIWTRSTAAWMCAGANLASNSSS